MIDSWDNHRNVISCVLTARHHLIISFLFMHIKNVRQLVYRLQVQHINKYNGVVIWTRKQNEKLVKPHFFQDNPGENPGETTQVRKPRWDNPSEKIQVRQPRWDNPNEMIQVRQPRWDNPGEIIQVRQPRWDNPGELTSNQSKYTSPTVITFITNLSDLLTFSISYDAQHQTCPNATFQIILTHTLPAKLSLVHLEASHSPPRKLYIITDLHLLQHVRIILTRFVLMTISSKAVTWQYATVQVQIDNCVIVASTTLHDSCTLCPHTVWCSAVTQTFLYDWTLC